jgi:hypothetical protein
VVVAEGAAAAAAGKAVVATVEAMEAAKAGAMEDVQQMMEMPGTRAEDAQRRSTRLQRGCTATGAMIIFMSNLWATTARR